MVGQKPSKFFTSEEKNFLIITQKVTIVQSTIENYTKAAALNMIQKDQHRFSSITYTLTCKDPCPLGKGFRTKKILGLNRGGKKYIYIKLIKKNTHRDRPHPNKPRQRTSTCMSINLQRWMVPSCSSFLAHGKTFSATCKLVYSKIRIFSSQDLILLSMRRTCT